MAMQKSLADQGLVCEMVKAIFIFRICESSVSPKHGEF